MCSRMLDNAARGWYYGIEQMFYGCPCAEYCGEHVSGGARPGEEKTMRAAGEDMRERIRLAIAELTVHNNRPPTNREIGERLGRGGKALSTGHIDYHLRILREQGVIAHDPKK